MNYLLELPAYQLIILAMLIYATLHFLVVFMIKKILKNSQKNPS
jgi:hypothetical protein